jgi:APA family basic amino acid/polyamine antiporter
LRKREPDLPRAFKTPAVPVVPILGIITCVVMMISLPLGTWIRLFVWLVIGLLVYFFYGKKNSKAGREALKL